ncbi:MAG: ribonuclease J [Acidobacteria bacterium]|nr:ribonuclease J [Acidobacteriota bacterium]
MVGFKGGKNISSTSGTLRAIPLGGLGEFGMNMMAFEYDDHLVVVDCGLMFPDAEMLGVDIVIPDIAYLRQNQERIRAILLTHGHEDHIGALPYVLDEIDAPVYGTPFTLALARAKLVEQGMADVVELREMKPGAPFEVGPFRVEFIHLTHSIIQAGALALTTPLGTVIHTGDFKFDPTPTDGKVSDLHTLADYGRRGVLALFSDSTNIDRPGMTPSERAVRERFEEIMAEAKGRVLISCFSTSLHRMQIVTDLAAEYGRRLCFVGRSMFQNSEIAQQMGLLRVPEGMILQPQDLRKAPRNQVAVLVAGSQGEPMAALSRVAVDKHRWLKIEPGDDMVISARVIPGNEKSIFRMIDHLYRRGARIHYQDGSQPPVHVSGHGSAEEMKLMLNLVRPKYFVPIHGEYRQLYRHAAAARELGAVSKETFLLESGDVLEFDAQGARRNGRVPVGRVCIDVGTLDEVGDVILKERRHISEDGIVIPILAINEHTGQLETRPEIVSRGFVPLDEARELVESAREVILSTIEKSNPEEVGDWGVIKEKIRIALRRHFDEETGKRPMILPVVLEV